MRKYILVLGCLFFSLFQGAWANNTVRAQNMVVPLVGMDVSYTPREIGSGRTIGNLYTVRNNHAITIEAETEFRYAFNYRDAGALEPVGNYDGYTLFRFRQYPEVGLVLEGGSDGDSNKVSYNGSTKYHRDAEHYLGGLALYPTKESQGGSGDENQRDYDLTVSAKIVLFKELKQDITIPYMAIGTAKVSFCYFGSEDICHRNDEYAGTTQPVGHIFINGFTLKAKPKTCSIVGNRDITVQLQEVMKRNFTTNNSEQFGGNVSFNLRCSDSIGRVYATLEDARNANNNTELLDIETGTGKAKNVGIVLKNKNDGNRNLSYKRQPSDTVPISNISNKWEVTSGNNKTPNINLDVYYRRKGDISPGEVNAKTTIKFTYE